MSKILLVFIHGNNPGTYINVLTHCCLHEDISEIYFVGEQATTNKRSELYDFVKQIKTEVDKLTEEHEVYKVVQEAFPRDNLLEDGKRILRTVYISPQSLLQELRASSFDSEKLIIDISGCSKRLASDIITSYMAANVNHICHFELDDKVYSEEWKAQQRGKMYHDLVIGSHSYYVYDDLSASGVTLESITKLRSQKRWVKALMLIVVVLGIAIAFLVSSQQNSSALALTIILALITGVGAFEDTFSFFERIRN